MTVGLKKILVVEISFKEMEGWRYFEKSLSSFQRESTRV